MIESVIRDNELELIIESVEKHFNDCYYVSTFYKREKLEMLLGKLYNLVNDRCATNIIPNENRIEVKKMSINYVIKHY